MNPTDPQHPWSRLVAAARRASDDRDTAAPYGFATRVAALAFTQERKMASLVERFALRAVGVRVHTFDDHDHTRPDSVFPNNWFSTHAGGQVGVFPMYASNRRHERRADVLEMLKSEYRVQAIVDYSGLEPDGSDWIADGPLGAVRVSFVPANEFGVIDHTVTIESGLRVYNALRIVPNGDGCEAMFTLLRLPGMTDEQFAADAAHITRDLATLKSMMEK